MRYGASCSGLSTERQLLREGLAILHMRAVVAWMPHPRAARSTANIHFSSDRVCADYRDLTDDEFARNDLDQCLR